MSKPRRNPHSAGPDIPPDDALWIPKKRKPIPHEFVLDALAAVSPRTNPMFGCLAVYLQDKIVLILRDRPTAPADNGVWLATTVEHHASLRADFPSMRSIGVLGKDVTGWQILPADSPDFEEAALRACELVMARDPRIGKVPKSRWRADAGVSRQSKARQNESREGKTSAKQKKKPLPTGASQEKIQAKKKTKKKTE